MPANTAETLNVLARMKDPGNRQALALGVTELCLAQPLSSTAEPIAGDLLVTLTSTADDATKTTIATQLSGCKWAPHAAVRFLAFEPIEISGAIIQKSEVLT